MSTPPRSCIWSRWGSPTPRQSATWLETAPCDAPLQVLTTPEVFEFGPSSLQDETNIVYAVEAEYNAGDMSATDPLTVFAYSQSVIAASAAEKVLSQDGVPQDDLHFVFIGDPSDANGIATNIYADLVQLFGGGTTGTTLTNDVLPAINEDQFAPGGLLAGDTPDDLYQTTVYTIDTDGVADWQEDWNAALAADNGNTLDALGSGIYHFFTTHVEYLGLTPAEVAYRRRNDRRLDHDDHHSGRIRPGHPHQRYDGAGGRIFTWDSGQRSVHRLAGNRRRPLQPCLRLTPAGGATHSGGLVLSELIDVGQRGDPGQNGFPSADAELRHTVAQHEKPEL